MNDHLYITAEDELEPGERVLVTADKTSIGVFNVDREYYAIENTCAHQQGPLCEGKVQGALEGERPGRDRIPMRLSSGLLMLLTGQMIIWIYEDTVLETYTGDILPVILNHNSTKTSISIITPYTHQR